MQIKISINDDDFLLYSQKAAELNLEPLDAIELLINKSLKELNLKSVL